jgi:biopolymer transport protein ExbD
MALKRQHQTLSMFSMASMTDIIFLLLIFFMVTSTFVFPSALEVNLPQSSEQTAIKPSTRIYVDKSLNMYATQTNDIGETDLMPIAPEQLEELQIAIKKN